MEGFNFFVTCDRVIPQMERCHQSFEGVMDKNIDVFMVMRKNTNMRTTLDLPDELVTEIKILAAQERSTLKELIGDLLRSGLRTRITQSRPSALPRMYRPSRGPITSSWVSQIRQEVRG